MGVWLQLLVRWWDTHLTVQIKALLYSKTPHTFRKEIYIYYRISWNLHQHISMTGKMLVRIQVLDSTSWTRSRRTTDRFGKVTFEVTNCWNVIAPECVYCQVCALQNWMVSFAPRKSVSVSNAGSNVSTIWTPHVIKTFLMLRKLLLTIYTIIQNGTWERLITVHALWVTFWCKLALVYVFIRQIYMESWLFTRWYLVTCILSG